MVVKPSSLFNTSPVIVSVILGCKMMLVFKAMMTSTVLLSIQGKPNYSVVVIVVGCFVLFVHMYSQFPTTGNTVRVRFIDGSRGVLDSSNELLQNFILSEGLRIRLIDYFTDNTTSQHRYYGIADFTVAAR